MRSRDTYSLTQFDSPMTRAAMLRRAGGAVVGTTLAGGLLAACGGSGSSSSSAAGSSAATAASAAGTTNSAVSGTVAFLGWQGYDDKAAAKAVTDQGVKLAVTYITNNDEILTKLRSGGIGQIDVVTPYFGYIPPMIKAGLLEPVDYSKLPSTKGYFPDFVRPSWNTAGDKVYSAPLVWADTPMVYRKDKISDLPASYQDLKDPAYKGKLVTLDDPLGNIILFAKALYGDKPTEITKAQLADVMKLLAEIRPNVVTIGASFGDVLDILSRGDAALCIAGWRFLQVQAKEKGITLDVYTPKEGSFSWCDNYCIPKDAPHPDATYAFIDQMISAKGNAVVAADSGSAVTNKDALVNLPAEQKTLYPYDGIADYFKSNGLYGLPPLEAQGDTATFQDWQAAWQEFKSA